MESRSMASVGCACCISRRRLLAAGCGACAALVSPGGLSRWGFARDEPRVASESAASQRPRVRLIFSCWAVKQDRPTWPHIGYDFTADIEHVRATLEAHCPQVEFLPVVAHSPEDAQQLLAQGDADRIDGYIVCQLNNWVRVMQTIVDSGKPTIIADFPFAGSGGFLVFTAEMRRTHNNFSVVASSRVEDLAEAAKCFEIVKRGGSIGEFVTACDRVRRERTAHSDDTACHADPLPMADVASCLEALKSSRLLTVGGAMQNIAAEIQQRLGIEVRPIAFEELSALCAQADADRAHDIAARWQSAARNVAIDDPDATLEQSARLYLAQQALLEKHRAEAITINCLGGFYGGHLTAYPCLGFVELLDEGLVGACEADLLSTTTMLVMKHLIGRPGFISDPVLDTSKRQIIYAHCVAPTRMFGPDGGRNEFEILTHAEDRKGASVRSFLPLGYMTTTMEIHPARQEILMHRAKAVENVVMDRACRTKLAGEVVGDMEQLFAYWNTYGWHRVTFYGDLQEPVRELAAALKFTVVKEA